MIEVFGGIDYGGTAHFSSVVVDEDIAHNGEYPTFEVDVIYVFGLVVEYLQGSVLHQIQGGFSIGRQLEREVSEVPLQSKEALFEC